MYFISDFQNSNFSLDGDSVFYDWGGNLFAIPVRSDLDNLSFQGGGFENKIFQPDAPMKLYVDVKNHGEQERDNILCRITLQGKAVAQRIIRLEPGEQSRVRFQILPGSSSWQWGSVTIEDESFSRDNEWFFTYRIPQKYNIFIVGKSEDYIESVVLALEPRKNEKGLFSIQTSNFRSNWTQEISDMHAVILVNYPLFKSGEPERIRRFIEQGGGLFFIPGEDIDLRNMNLFFQDLFELSFAEIAGNKNQTSGSIGFGKIDYGHPLFEGVFEEGKENIRSPIILKWLTLVNQIPSSVIELSNGMPFLIERDAGLGKVLICTGGISPDWSNLTNSTFFAPLINRGAAYLSAGEIITSDIVLGEDISFSAGLKDLDSPYFAEDPSGEEIFILPKVDEGRVHLDVENTRLPGLYRFYQGDELLGIVAVNLDNAESDFRPINTEDFENRFPNAKVIWVNENDDVGSMVMETRWGRELWREMIILGLLALICEMMLSRTRKREDTI
jgi:hypothetical protein